MHLSMFFGPFARGFASEIALLDLMTEQALEADQAGFTGIYVGEQHNNDYEPYADPFGMGGYLAAQLRHAYVGTTVVPLVLHHPLMLIERINLLDQLTRGRCIIGMSSGHPGNGIAFGIHTWPADERQRLFDQRLDVLLRAWAHRPEDGPLAFETDREKGIMPGRVMPYSYRVPHPLFAVCTNTGAKLTDAGRNGYLAHLGPFSLAQAAERAAQYRQGLEDGGHDVAEKMKWLFSTKWIYVAETDDAAFADAERFWGAGWLLGMPWLTDKERFKGMTFRQIHESDPGPLGSGAGAPESPAAWSQRCHIIGSPETVAAELLKWERSGFPHIHARWVMDGLHLDLYQRSWRLFVDEVMPRLDVARIAPPTEEEIRPEFRSERTPAQSLEKVPEPQ